MVDTLQNLLTELERFGRDNDSATAERPEYSGWWPHLRRVLRRGGLLVVDNATSHPAEIAPFVALVKADAEFISSLVPVGNGEFLAARSVT